LLACCAGGIERRRVELGYIPLCGREFGSRMDHASRGLLGVVAHVKAV